MSDADQAVAQRPAGPVIPAAELGLWTEATVVLGTVRAHAEAMQQQAQAALEAERARGFEAGLRAAAGEVAKQFARLAAHRAALETEMEAALPKVVCDVVERLLGETPAASLLSSTIRHVLAQQRWDGKAVLRVSPADQATARAAVQGDPRAVAITVEPDVALPDGSCQFECAHGSIALGLAAQLRALRDGLEKGWLEAAAREAAAPSLVAAA